MKELEHIQFFQLRSCLRGKKILKGLKNSFDKREKTSETFEQKQLRIKELSKKLKL